MLVEVDRVKAEATNPVKSTKTEVLLKDKNKNQPHQLVFCFYLSINPLNHIQINL
ncbi:hypothetical protein O185_03205 [Photorhabdus temperata J3]|uniref:Uncharacterized protein n=1 Tax=Photorhabdus temperata J3 TaxID=1389415 RepID=U7R2Y5_PHOTE|nr:hypothetical protein O185_03205 [Photorhabdus temperata J3]